MESRRPSDLSLPYGKIAMWGLAASVLVTGAVLLAAPFSPVRLAVRALGSGEDVAVVLPLDGHRLPTPAEMGRRAVQEVLGRHHGGDAARARVHARLRVAPELRAELSREWVHLLPELRAELSREWVHLLPELTSEVATEWTRIAPELQAEMRRELRGLRVELEAAPPGIVLGGG